jgi:hypothetical protein
VRYLLGFLRYVLPVLLALAAAFYILMVVVGPWLRG